MRSRPINLTLPDGLLIEIDEAAKANYESRSDYIRESIVLRLTDKRVISKEVDELIQSLKQFKKPNN